MSEDTRSHYAGLLQLLERLAAGDTVDEVIACEECNGAPDDEAHGSLLGEMEPNGWHDYAPEDEDAASAVEDYELSSTEDLIDALNTVTLAIEVIRKGDLSSAGDITSINLIMTTGGPHAQLNINSSGGVYHEHIEWFRGPGTFDLYVGSFPALAQSLYDLAEELEAANDYR